VTDERAESMGKQGQWWVSSEADLAHCVKAEYYGFGGKTTHYEAFCGLKGKGSSDARDGFEATGIRLDCDAVEIAGACAGCIEVIVRDLHWGREHHGSWCEIDETFGTPPTREKWEKAWQKANPGWRLL
jgi:hypothetical protein